MAFHRFTGIAQQASESVSQRSSVLIGCAGAPAGPPLSGDHHLTMTPLGQLGEQLSPPPQHPHFKATDPRSGTASWATWLAGSLLTLDAMIPRGPLAVPGGDAALVRQHHPVMADPGVARGGAVHADRQKSARPSTAEGPRRPRSRGVHEPRSAPRPCPITAWTAGPHPGSADAGHGQHTS